MWGGASSVGEKRKKLRAAFNPFLTMRPIPSSSRHWMKSEATRERQRLEQEDAKNRDLKSLFNQLAKAFHPDREPDPLLKEQIGDLKRQTHHLLDLPQYGPLQRFRHPYYGTLASPVTLKRTFRAELQRHREMLETLQANDAASRRMIYQWADENARQSSYTY